MPGPGLEVAEPLVQHQIQLTKHFDAVTVGVSVIRGDVMAYAVTNRAPYQTDPMFA